DEDAVADDRCAALLAAAGDTDGDVLRQAAVVSDAAFGREDDAAVMADVEAFADLAVGGEADAGDDLEQLLGEQHERPREPRAPEKRARKAVDAACPEALREEHGAQGRIGRHAVAAEIAIQMTPPGAVVELQMRAVADLEPGGACFLPSRLAHRRAAALRADSAWCDADRRCHDRHRAPAPPCALPQGRL